jgi:hypothetical protein
MKWAKELPAIPDPEMRTLGLDMVRVMRTGLIQMTLQESQVSACWKLHIR